MNNIEVSGARRGFTLVELLTVIAIMSVLFTLTMPAITGFSSSRNEATALNTAEGLASAARQQAVSKGTMVALLFSRTSGTVNNTQAFFLMQAAVTGTGGVTWTPFSSWVSLPAGVSLTPYVRNGVTTFYSMSSGTSFSLPTTWNNHDLANDYYIVFYPDGSVGAPASGPAINLQPSTRQSSANPDYTLLIQDGSGRTKIISGMQ